MIQGDVSISVTARISMNCSARLRRFDVGNFFAEALVFGVGVALHGRK
jgi:hypothetical protein